jgi:DNA-directed RNA polymerase subunit RPC12/RpoP
MSQATYVCYYCGHRFTATPWRRQEKCPTCGDKRIKIDKSVDKTNVYGYPEESKNNEQEKSNETDDDHGYYDQLTVPDSVW